MLEQRVIVTLDGKEIIRWQGKPDQLTRTWPAPEGRERMPYLYAIRTKWSVSHLEVTPIESMRIERNRTAASLFAPQWSMEQELGLAIKQSKHPGTLRGAHRGVFYLGLHDPPLDRHRIITGSLLREIGRQSLLLTARDEFGLVTRDLAFRDQFPWKPEEASDSSPQDESLLSVYSLVNYENQALMVIFAADRTDPLWHSEFTVASEAPYASFVSRAEEFSRGPLIEFLKARQKEPRPLKWSDAGVPQEILSTEEQFDVFTQYENVRKLHDVIRASGESTARLTCLARTYVHLGELTSTYLSPMSKAFQARALLYAERAVAKSGNSPESLWSRAYVRAWCGFPFPALDDLQAAKKRSAEFAPPAWSTDLELYCRGNHRQLEERVLNGEGARISEMLNWFARKSDANKENVFSSLATASAKYDDCLHLLFAASMIRSLGAQATIRSTISEIPPLLQLKLAGIPGLPDSVSKIIDQPEELTYQQIETVIRDLLATEKSDATPSAEISHALLGQIINEMMMRATWSIVRYERNSLGIPVVDRIAEMKPLVANHPHGPAIESLAERSPEGYYKARAWFRSTNTLMIEPAAYEFVKFFSYVNKVDGKKIHQAYAIRHLDESSNDLLRRIEQEESRDNKLLLLGRLQTVAPGFPMTVQMRLKLDADACKDQLPEWEQRFQNDPGLLKEIASAYLQTGQIEAAERVLERCLTIEPSFVNAKAYADQALVLGDREEWVARSEEALNYQVLGLEHARLNVELSKYFLSLDELRKAMTYAERAATSGAAWTYTHLVDVYTALERWEEAEFVLRRLVQRYPGSGIAWFQWCLRTGQGDLKAAAEVAQEYYVRHPQRLITDLEKFQYAFYHRTAGDPSMALRVMKSIVDRSQDPYFAWHALILAETLEQPKYVDELLAKIIEWEQSGRSDAHLSGTLRIAQMLLKLRQEKRPGEINLQQLDIEISTLKHGNPVTMWFILGQYLAYHGRVDEGIRYLERAAASPTTTQWDQWLATFYLSQFDHKVPPRRKSVQVPVELPASLGELDLYTHPSPPLRVDFLGDSDRVVTSAQDGIVRIWEPGTSEPVSEQDVEGYHFAVSRDGQFISSMHERGEGGTVWNLSAWTKEKVYPKSGAYRPLLGFIGNDPARVVANDELLQGTQVRNWHGRVSKYRTGSQEFEWVHPVGDFHLYLMTSDESGKELFLALGNQTSVTRFERVSADSGELLEERVFPRTRLSRAGMSGDRKYLLTVSGDGELAVRSVQNWNVLFRAIVPGTTAAALSPDASLLAIGLGNGNALLADGRTGRIRAMFGPHLKDVLQMKFNRSGRLLVTIGDDFQARTWDVQKLLASHQSDAADAPNYRIVETNSLGMELIPIPAGTFEMGSSIRTQERPIHSVQIAHRFLMSRFEVTVGEFRTFVEATDYKTEAERSGQGGKHLPAPYGELVQSPEYVWDAPGFEQSEDHPVVQVSWNDARAFCEWLSRKEGRNYRLPTEAEWEYACRGTSSTQWFFGAQSENYPSYANVRDVSLAKRYNLISALQPKSDGHAQTAAVGSYLPNGFGLYDTHGNVREWCSDHYSASYYAKSPPADPAGPDKGNSRVHRGGSYLESLDFTRSSHRGYDSPSEARSDLGFRVICEEQK